MKKPLVLISIVFIMAAIDGRGGQEQLSQLQPAFPIDRLAVYENCTVLHVNATWIVVAHSKRLNDQHSKSEFLAYRFENHKWKQVFSKAFEDAYNARIELRHDMQYRDNPIMVFRVQYGAAVEQLEIYGISLGSMHFLQTLESGLFEWSRQTNDPKVLLVAVPPHADEQRIVYSWNGAQFHVVPSPTGK
jgi:hypothetical protein